MALQQRFRVRCQGCIRGSRGLSGSFSDYAGISICYTLAFRRRLLGWNPRHFMPLAARMSLIEDVPEGLRWFTDDRPGHHPRAAAATASSTATPTARPVTRREDPGPHPQAGHPAGLDRRLDLPARQRPHPGHRPRREGPQAVPLPRRLERGPRPRTSSTASPPSAAPCPASASASTPTSPARPASATRCWPPWSGCWSSP